MNMATFIYADYWEAETSIIRVDGKPEEVMELIAGIVAAFSKEIELDYHQVTKDVTKMLELMEEKGALNK